MNTGRSGAKILYPMSDFTMPFVPDLESQELPFCVVLNARDGSAMQLSCEDDLSQRQVLKTLRGYYTGETDSKRSKKKRFPFG